MWYNNGTKEREVRTMNLFSIGFLLGTMLKSNKTTTPQRPNDKVQYSCLWWGEEAGRTDLSKEKIACLLVSAYHNSLVRKKLSDDGLCTYIPCSKKAKEEILKTLAECSSTKRIKENKR